jgi:hypothetical protein
MSSSTKMCFPLPAPPRPPTSTPSLSPIRVPIPPRHLPPRHRPLTRPRRTRAYLMQLRRPHSHACLRHARPRRPRLCHARPRRPRLRLVQPQRLRPPQRAGLASPTPPLSTAVAGALLPRRPRTQAPRRTRPDSPTLPSSIIVAGRLRPWPLSRRCTTPSSFTAPPGTLTPW